MTDQDIDILFTYHNPVSDAPQRFEEIRNAAKALGKAIIAHGGKESDIERSILKLRECVFYAIASIVVPIISIEKGE